ncbi:MAG: DUF1513 domain-containing protein [Rhodobiaceae bacterium]|nr:DUF1513 domain-containing protein [Rhodobiaceae bacterium]
MSTALMRPSLASSPGARWMGCRQVRGQHYASLFDGAGKVHINIPLPGRGHGIVATPGGRHALVMARRPGTFILVIELDTGSVAHEITTSIDHHFYGHGCFSNDGNFLYTTQNDTETGQGVIAVRDATNAFALITTFPSGGIGPHEIALMPDGLTLAVANGGILTLPELGRTKLNLDTMSPSLTLINRETGKLLADHHLAADKHQLSIRHMSVGPSGIALALQYEGPKTDTMPLLALFNGQTLQLIETPASEARAMRNYAGSVAHDPSGEIVALACPRGNLISFWDATSGAALGRQTIADVCGIAPGNQPGEFIVTGGQLAAQSSLSSLTPTASFADTQWDNHLQRIA